MVMGLYRPSIEDNILKDQLLDALRIELKGFISKDRILTSDFAIYGGITNGCSMEDVLEGLLRLAIAEGETTAAKSFYKRMDDDHVVLQQYFMLTGIKIEEEIRLFDGIHLLPLPTDTELLPGYLPLTFSPDLRADHFSGGTLLRIDLRVGPVFVKPDSSYSLDGPGPMSSFSRKVHSNDIDDFHPQRFFQALFLATGCLVEQAVQWQHLSDDQMFTINIGGGLSYRLNELARIRNTTMDDSQLKESIAVYGKMTSLFKNRKVEDWLRVPIDRLIKSKAQGDLVDKMIDVGIALESFYLRNTENRELAFKMSLRAALYLGPEARKRKSLLYKFIEIYAQRSHAVHQGKKSEIMTNEFVEEAQELCKTSILKALDDGIEPNWNKLVLGDL